MLADTYALYLKSQNSIGMSLEIFFQYSMDYFKLNMSIWPLLLILLLKGIRAKGSYAPGSFSEFLKLTSVKDSIFEMNAKNMLEELYQDNLKVIKTANDLLNILRECNDPVTTDIVTRRIEVHEKNIWMIGSMLEA